MPRAGPREPRDARPAGGRLPGVALWPRRRCRTAVGTVPGLFRSRSAIGTANTGGVGWHPRKVESRARREGWSRRAANRGRAGEYLIPAEPDGISGGVADGANSARLAE